MRVIFYRSGGVTVNEMTTVVSICQWVSLPYAELCYPSVISVFAQQSGDTTLCVPPTLPQREPGRAH